MKQPHATPQSSLEERTPSSHSERWYRFVHWLCQRIYYSRVTLIHPERLPAGGERPVLYLSLHRNGAMDGFIHHALFPKILFLITRNLRRSRFLRYFFSGIEVVRSKDSQGKSSSRRAANLEALNRCQSVLAANGQLLVFPEGTSGLGPHHLPFQGGAARILLRFLEEHPGRPLAVVPLGIHYERAWSFRSRAHVVVGAPLATDLPPAASKRERRDELQRRIEESLKAVGANFPSAEHQEVAERLAYASTLGTAHSYFASLKRFETHIPKRIQASWQSLEKAAKELPVWRHQGVPLFPLKRTLLPAYGLWFLLIAPLVLLAALLNAPPLAASALAGKTGADDRNVIALWRVLIGAPTMLIWIVLLALVAGMSGHLLLLAPYLAVSLAGLCSYYRVKKLAVIIHNGLRVPSLGPDALRLHESVLENLNNEHTISPTTHSILRAG